MSNLKWKVVWKSFGKLYSQKLGTEEGAKAFAAMVSKYTDSVQIQEN